MNQSGFVKMLLYFQILIVDMISVTFCNLNGKTPSFKTPKVYMHQNGI